MRSERGALTYSDLVARAAAAGLAVRGAFHPVAGEFAGLDAGTTLVLLGFTGGVQWPRFAASPEAADGAPHPLDRWSRRVIDALADACAARALYPGDRPALPFQQLARRAEPVQPSPLGLLIHPTYGLWHAYRGALLLDGEFVLPSLVVDEGPCGRCALEPCRDACPVGAFRHGTLDVPACVGHLRSAAGADCREHGCRARRACPEGAAYRYGSAQMRFHLQAFVDAVDPRASLAREA